MRKARSCRVKLGKYNERAVSLSPSRHLGRDTGDHVLAFINRGRKQKLALSDAAMRALITMYFARNWRQGDRLKQLAADLASLAKRYAE